jgi:hypothetical protein
MALNKISESIFGHPNWHATLLRDFDEWVHIVKSKTVEVIFRGQRIYHPLLPSICCNNNPDSLLSHEKEMMRQFKSEAPSCLHLLPETEWDWLVVAQHHGLPTRLLDWSYDPYVALWFALERAEDNKSEPEVWVLKPEAKDIILPSPNFSPYSGSRTKVFKPSFDIPRVRVQKGCFTAFRFIPETKNGFVPLEKNKYLRHRLERVRIAKYSIKRFKKPLYSMGYTRSTLYPDLDKVAKRIKDSVVGEKA